MSETNPNLLGRRVLVVEDRYLLAAELADALAAWGAQVLGPAANVADAREVIAGASPDVALLDVNLNGEEVFPLAEQLDQARVPLIFLSGYEPEVLPEPWRDRPALRKPVELDALLAALAQAFGRR